MIWICFIPAVLLIIGMADLPIGYYTFLRIVVFITSCILAYAHYSQENKLSFGAVLFGLIALLFNPLLPVYLNDKDTWAALDMISAIIFAAEYFVMRNKESAK